MEIIYLLGIIAVVVAITLMYIRKINKEKPVYPDTKPAKEQPMPIIKVGGTLKTDVNAENVESKTQKSLDRLYAETHDMWVCPFCETLNKNDKNRCVGCDEIRVYRGVEK